MSYELRTLVAANPVASLIAARLPGSQVIPIGQGLALVPMVGRWLSGPVLAALPRLGAGVDPARSDFSDFGLYQRRRAEAWLEDPPKSSS